MLRILFATKKNCTGRTADRIGWDGGDGEGYGGIGGSCGKSSNYYLRSLFFVPFLFVLLILFLPPFAFPIS